MFLPVSTTCSQPVQPFERLQPAQGAATYEEPIHGHPESCPTGCEVVPVLAGAHSVGLHMRLLHPVQAGPAV